MLLVENNIEIRFKEVCMCIKIQLKALIGGSV